MNDVDLKLLIDKVDLLIRITAFQIVKDQGSTKDRAELLDRLGVDRKEIGKICDTSPDAVRALISQARKKQKKVN